MGAHGAGKWFGNDDIELENGRVVAYSATESHGLYPNIGIIKRFFGVGDDTTSKTYRYDCIDSVIVLANPASIYIDKYFKKNQLHYYNGRINDQYSNMFNERRTNVLMLPSGYKFESIASIKTPIIKFIPLLYVAMGIALSLPIIWLIWFTRIKKEALTWYYSIFMFLVFGVGIFLFVFLVLN